MLQVAHCENLVVIAILSIRRFEEEFDCRPAPCQGIQPGVHKSWGFKNMPPPPCRSAMSGDAVDWLGVVYLRMYQGRAPEEVLETP